MELDTQNAAVSESYVVEIDGKIASAYGIFVEALKTGLELKQKFPLSLIKIHDADERVGNLAPVAHSMQRSRRLRIGLK